MYFFIQKNKGGFIIRLKIIYIVKQLEKRPPRQAKACHPSKEGN
jgi:hypothetical protein